jgi:hypothetical protein
MQSRPPRRRTGTGAIVIGGILIIVGAYYVLRNTFGIDLPELDDDAVWPLLVLAIGALFLLRGVVLAGPGRDSDEAISPR